MTDESVVVSETNPNDQCVLQLPVRVVIELVRGDESDPGNVLRRAVLPWAVVYRYPTPRTELHVEGFGDKDALSSRMADLYRTTEIVAVLHNGRPVKFDMRVKARIG